MQTQVGDAVPSTGRDVYLIKDKKIVGYGHGSSSVDGQVSIEFKEDESEIVRLINANSSAQKIASCVERWTPVKVYHPVFSMYSGGFVRTPFAHDSDPVVAAGEQVIDAYLDDTHVVDSFYFDHGLVPAFFKEVEGCGKLTCQSHRSA